MNPIHFGKIYQVGPDAMAKLTAEGKGAFSTWVERKVPFSELSENNFVVVPATEEMLTSYRDQLDFTIGSGLLFTQKDADIQRSINAGRPALLRVGDYLPDAMRKQEGKLEYIG